MPNSYVLANPRTQKYIGNRSDLHGKKITIIGLGAGGEIALHALRSGITKMDLYDFDMLEEGNLIRHVCGFRYIGQNKAHAVKDLLGAYLGAGSDAIVAYPHDIFEVQDLLSESIMTSDLTLVGTDTDASKFYVNEICVRLGRAAIYYGMYEDGCGGELFASLPGAACFECIAHHSERSAFIHRYVRSLDKRDCTSTRDISGMPGFGIDQSYMNAIVSRKALDLLIGDDTLLRKIGRAWIIWSFSGIQGALEASLASLQADFPIHPSCRLCGQKGGEDVIRERV